MVLFASPRAYLRFGGATAPAEGIRWFHEPGAWVERPRLPSDSAEPSRAPAPLTIARRLHER